MLFWKVVIDGDGVGDGEVACDAGATTSSIATTEAKTAPITFSNLPGRLCGEPLGVLLKMKILHLGGGQGCAIATTANVTGRMMMLSRRLGAWL
ncbi:hypothetical protein [Arthrobacter sp. Soil762]|uniref:hypothetical protein n=1 Tax=Arthrobacter sp. Soil762 TaxID=1736401 RepID=UPI001F1E2419|nr:hypothetical protein [Arthrobacter sp. Soil762]